MQLAGSWWAQPASPALALGTRGGVPSWERQKAGQGQERKSALACVVSGVLASSSEWRNPHSPRSSLPFSSHLLTVLAVAASHCEVTEPEYSQVQSTGPKLSRSSSPVFLRIGSDGGQNTHGRRPFPSSCLRLHADLCVVAVLSLCRQRCTSFPLSRTDKLRAELRK